MKRILLVESMTVHASGSRLLESTGGKGYVVEQKEGESLKIRLPVTILDEKNENGRVYSRSMMEGSLRGCTEAFQNKELLSTIDGHPSDPYVEPGNASHIVTEAWVEGKTLYNTWEVMETSKGKDLAALVKAGASFGVSIRGLGSQDNFGNILEDYEYLGTDGVGQPSARIRTRPEVVVGNEPRSYRENVENQNRQGTPMPKARAATFSADFRSRLKSLTESTDPIRATQQIIEMEESLNSESGLPLTIAGELVNELSEAKKSLRTSLSGSDIKEALELAEAALATANKQNATLKAGLAENATKLRRVFTAGKNLQTQLAEANQRIGIAEAQARTSNRLYQFALRESAVIHGKYSGVVKKLAESDLSRRVAIREALQLLARRGKVINLREFFDDEAGYYVFNVDSHKIVAGPFATHGEADSHGGPGLRIAYGLDSHGQFAPSSKTEAALKEFFDDEAGYYAYDADSHKIIAGPFPSADAATAKAPGAKVGYGLNSHGQFAASSKTEGLKTEASQFTPNDPGMSGADVAWGKGPDGGIGYVTFLSGWDDEGKDFSAGIMDAEGDQVGDEMNFKTASEAMKYAKSIGVVFDPSTLSDMKAHLSGKGVALEDSDFGTTSDNLGQLPMNAQRRRPGQLGPVVTDPDGDGDIEVVNGRRVAESNKKPRFARKGVTEAKTPQKTVRTLVEGEQPRRSIRESGQLNGKRNPDRSITKANRSREVLVPGFR